MRAIVETTQIGKYKKSKEVEDLGCRVYTTAGDSRGADGNYGYAALAKSPPG